MAIEKATLFEPAVLGIGPQFSILHNNKVLNAPPTGTFISPDPFYGPGACACLQTRVY
jgi:hypothetical protein